MIRKIFMVAAGIIAFALSSSMANAVPVLLIDGGSEASTDLIANSMDVGDVTLGSDDISFFVEYTTDSPSILHEMHVWLGDNINDLPKGSSGDPIPGQFPFSGDAGGANSYTFTIPFLGVGFDLNALVGEETWYLAAHAVVETNTVLETSFAGDIVVGRGRASSVTLSAAPIPEPSSLLLLGIGLLGVVRIARRRKS